MDVRIQRISRDFHGFGVLQKTKIRKKSRENP
ncbi:MAG: hypothetical protein RL329_2352 [Bacteroidota bacterium]|jgi:hypothetical protein